MSADERRQGPDRRLVSHYRDQLRLSQLEAALDECVHYIETTCGPEDDLPEPECSKKAKALLGWTL